MQISITSGRPSLALFDVDGMTKLRNLTTAIGIQFSDPVSAFGSITFSIPAADATDLTPGRWVKAYWRGFVPVAARLKKWTTEWAVDGIAYRSFEIIPGALAAWNDATVFPEYPLNKRTTGTDRNFGPMSNYINPSDSSWFIPADWTAAQGAPYTQAKTLKKRTKPPGLAGLNPWWIAKGDPFIRSVSANEVQWFRRGFTTYVDTPYTIYATADDYLTLYLDGEEIITPDQQNGQSFTTLVSVTGVLQAGTHLIAAKIANASYKGINNPVAFIFAMVRNDANGNPVKGPALLKSDRSWHVTDTNPGWHRSLVPLRLHEEAAQRGVRACQVLKAAWSGTTDSAGRPWTDKGIFIFPIGQMGLGDVTLQQCESKMDVHVDAARMRVCAYTRYGTDKYGSVELKLGKDGGSLKGFAETVNKARFNTGLLHLSDGTWIVRDDAPSVAGIGPVEIGVSLGSTPDDDTAGEVFAAAFSDNADPQQTWVIEISTLVGPQPYRQIFPGDSFKIPNLEAGGTVKARVMNIVIDGSGELLRAFLEVVRDRT